MFTQEQIQLTLQVHVFLGIQIVFFSLELLQTSLSDEECRTVGVTLISQSLIRGSFCYLLTTKTVESINNVMLVKIRQPNMIKRVIARFQTVYEDSLIWYNMEDYLQIQVQNGFYADAVFNHKRPGRLLGIARQQIFSSVAKFSEISKAMEYLYRFTYISGLTQMSSHGYIEFHSILFGICYFAIRYGEVGSESYPGLEFHASNYTWENIPHVHNMTNKFTYATVRLSSFYVTWEMRLFFNSHLEGTRGLSCSIQSLPWIPIRKPTIVTLSFGEKSVKEYYREYYNIEPGYFIRIQIIQLLLMPCSAWGLTIYAHSNSNDCLRYAHLENLCGDHFLFSYEYILPYPNIVLEGYLLSYSTSPVGLIKLRLSLTMCNTKYICSSIYTLRTGHEHVGYFNMFPVIRLFHHKYNTIIVTNESCLWYSIPLIVFKYQVIEHCAIHFILPSDHSWNCQIYSNIPHRKETNKHSFYIQLYRHPSDIPIQIPYGEFNSNLTVFESLYLIWSGNCFYAIFRMKFVIENITIVDPLPGVSVTALSLSSLTSQIRFQFKSVLHFRYMDSQKFARIREEFWLQHLSWSDVQLMYILKDQIPHIMFKISHDCDRNDMEVSILRDILTSVFWEQCPKNFTIDYFGKTAAILVTLRMKDNANCQVLFSHREVFVDEPSIPLMQNPSLDGNRVCPHNYTNLGDMCLLLLDSQQPKSWDTYQKACRMVDGDLISISNRAKSDIVKSFLQMEALHRNQMLQYAPMFIGLQRKYHKKVVINNVVK